jgi:hypothetical protein
MKMKIKMRMIYNNTNKLDRLLSNGDRLINHLRHLIKCKD